MYYVRCKDDKHNRRWKVREAVSLKAAISEISFAMVSGSIGGKTMVNGKTTADVVRVNSDNSECKPYELSY